MAEFGVSIIICCHNSANRLEPTLLHLKNQVVPTGISWEIVIIDNASTDETSQVTTKLWDFSIAPLRVVQEPKIGLSHARLTGFQEARYEFVSFVDDDNWVAPSWVETVYKVMIAHPDVGACGGKSEAVFEIEPPSWFGKYKKWFAVGEQTTKQGDVTWSRGCLWGAGLTIRKTAWRFLRENGFHPVLSGRSGTKLTSGEDNEICLVLRYAGWLLWYDESLSLKHYMSKGRMNWVYLRKLLRGSGTSSISINPYKLALKQYQEIPGRDGQKWIWELENEIIQLYKYRSKWLKSIFNLCEEDDDVLKVEILLGSIGEIVRQRGNYDKQIKNIKIAKWNLIDPKAMHSISR